MPTSTELFDYRWIYDRLQSVGHIKLIVQYETAIETENGDMTAL